MAARLVGMPAWQFLDDQAAVLAGGSLEFKEPGTSTDKSIWEDAAKNTEHSNPITLDAAGRPPNPVFAEGMYDITVKDSDGNTVTTISNWGTNFSTNSEQSPNLVCNYSFEDDDDADGVPDEWEFVSGTSGARITTDQIHGSASVKFTGTSSSSDIIHSCYIPVSENCSYEVQFEYKTSNSACIPRAVIRAEDSSQTLTSHTKIFEPTSSATTWTKTPRLRYTPASGDVWAKFRFIANTDGSAYDTYLDNVTVKEVPSVPQPGFRPTGLQISRDSGDTDHDLNVTSGSVIADDGVYPLILETEITKQGDASFAKGDDSGGLASGSSLSADSIIFLWLIGNSSTGEVDVLLDTSDTSPTLPSGWDKKRYIGGWTTDSSSNLEDGVYYGDRFIKLADPTAEIDDSTLTDAVLSESGTLQAPSHAVVDYLARVEILVGSATEFIGWIRPSNASWATAKMGTGLESSTDDLDELWWQGHVYIGTDRKIDYGVDWNSHGGSVQFVYYISGWDDMLRKEP